MSALAVEHQPPGGDDWDSVVRLWEEMGAPEGCKVEIIEGIVTVAPPPVNNRPACDRQSYHPPLR
ncbi:hypothetical protein [Streptomyces sp. NPDC054865]